MTGAHDAWLRRQQFGWAGTQSAFEDAYETVVLAGTRRDRLDQTILVMAADSEFTPVVTRLCCLLTRATFAGWWNREGDDLQ